MQWIPSEKKKQSDALFDGQVTEVYLIDGHALPPSAIHEALSRPEQEPDDLTIAYMAGFYDGKNTPQRKPDQEPVAMRYDFDGYGWLYIDNGSGSNWKEKIKNAEPLYTTPPKREWQSLTDEEKHDCYLRIDIWSRCYEMIEAKLREKNGG